MTLRRSGHITQTIRIPGKTLALAKPDLEDALTRYGCIPAFFFELFGQGPAPTSRHDGQYDTQDLLPAAQELLRRFKSSLEPETLTAGASHKLCIFRPVNRDGNPALVSQARRYEFGTHHLAIVIASQAALIEGRKLSCFTKGLRSTEVDGWSLGWILGHLYAVKLGSTARFDAVNLFERSGDLSRTLASREVHQYFLRLFQPTKRYQEAIDGLYLLRHSDGLPYVVLIEITIALTHDIKSTVLLLSTMRFRPNMRQREPASTRLT